MTRSTDERTATSNEAALRFRLRADGIADLPDHATLRRFAAARPAAFGRAILEFAGIAEDTDGTMAPALTAVLLEADLRPDDRLVVAGLSPWPWIAARTQGIAVIHASHAAPETLRAIALSADATAVAAPPAWLSAAGLDAAPASGPRGIPPTDPA